MNTPFVTCTCESPVIVLSIERVDFIRSMGPKMLEELYMQSKLFLIGVDELQAQWLQSKTWEWHKKHIVQVYRKDASQVKIMKRAQFDNEMNGMN
jgi:hypothetical protein